MTALQRPVLDPDRWRQAVELAAGWTAAGKLPALTFATGSLDRIVGPVSCGALTLDGQTPLPPQPIYLIASITKPLVAMGFLRLLERGLVTLGDRVADYIPEFGKHGKYGVEIRHLLTHTSGLPDMLPNNRELRAAQAPLSEFLKGVCDQPLSFPPGRSVQYQSTGFLVLAEILTRITGRSCPAFLAEEFFEPLGMCDTALGAPDGWFVGEAPRVRRIPEIRVPDDQTDAVAWNWNSRYWRQLGAPWGGLLTTANDLALYGQWLLRQGRLPNGRLLLAPATIAAATRNQLETMREVPEDERRCRPWGLGWRLNWPGHSANFGDLLGPGTYGHWGATGTVMWVDPERGVFAIIFSAQPQEPNGGYLARLSNAIAAAWC